MQSQAIGLQRRAMAYRSTMYILLTSENIIRTAIGGFACLVGLYGGDRAILFHASLFRSQFSGDAPSRLRNLHPKVLTGASKVAALVLTTVGFCLILLTNGSSPPVIVITVVGFLWFMGQSLFETLRALAKLQEGG
jgi:hypothetical protein